MRWTAGIAVLLLGCAGMPPRPDVDRPTAPPDLGWLAGTWAVWAPDGSRCTEERWQVDAAGRWQGAGRTVLADGSPLFAETLRIERIADRWTYLALPQGRTKPVPFRWAEGGPQRAVFVNPDHDFPKRITYERKGDVLEAEVHGTQGGKTGSEAWRYRRDEQGCPGVTQNVK